MTIPRLLGIAGSLRLGSYNRRLLEAATQVFPDADWTIARLRGIPPYDGDIEARGTPPAVAQLKDQIQNADAIVIATPEYNRSVPGVLKNAIDWASRPADRSPLVGKPVVMVAGSPGAGGAGRALDHLREILRATGAEPLPAQLSVPRVRDRYRDGSFDLALLDELREVLSQVEAPIGSAAGR